MLEPDPPETRPMRPMYARRPPARPTPTRLPPAGCRAGAGAIFSNRAPARPPVTRLTDCHFVVFSYVCLFVFIIYLLYKTVTKRVYIQLKGDFFEFSRISQTRTHEFSVQPVGFRRAPGGCGRQGDRPPCPPARRVVSGAGRVRAQFDDRRAPGRAPDQHPCSSASSRNDDET